MRVLLILVTTLLMTGQAYAYTFTQCIRDTAPDEQGVNESIQFIHFLEMVGKTDSSDENTAEFFDFVVDSFKRFEFKRLYKSDHLADWPEDYRGISFLSLEEGDRYDFRIIEREPERKLAAMLNGLGSFVADFALKKNDESPAGGRSYSAYLTSYASSGDLSYDNISRLLDGLMRVADPENLERLRYEANVAPGEPYDVVQAFEKAFPEFSRAYRPFTDVWTDAVIREKDGVRYTDVTLHIKPDIERMKQFYPNVARWQERQKGLMKMDIALLNDKGHFIVSFHIDTGGEIFALHANTMNGKVVPVDYNGLAAACGPGATAVPPAPHFDEAFSVAALDELDWKVDVAMANSVKGLDFETRKIAIDGHYQRDAKDMLFRLQMAGMPETEISGAVYGFIPLFLVDLFIPGNIEELIHDFSYNLLHANNDSGTFFNLTWDTRQPRDNRLNFLISSEFPDNSFIRFGLRILWGKLGMNANTEKDWDKLMNSLLGGLGQDLQNMRGRY